MKIIGGKFLVGSPIVKRNKVEKCTIKRYKRME